jgi:hypothetical protein
MFLAGGLRRVKTRTYWLEDLKGRYNLRDPGVRVRQYDVSYKKSVECIHPGQITDPSRAVVLKVMNLHKRQGIY